MSESNLPDQVRNDLRAIEALRNHIETQEEFFRSLFFAAWGETHPDDYSELIQILHDFSEGVEQQLATAYLAISRLGRVASLRTPFPEMKIVMPRPEVSQHQPANREQPTP